MADELLPVPVEGAQATGVCHDGHASQFDGLPVLEGESGGGDGERHAGVSISLNAEDKLLHREPGIRFADRGRGSSTARW